MSRIGRKPISIPEGVKVEIVGNVVVVSGQNGELKIDFLPQISVKVEDNSVILSKNDDEKQTGALFGLYRSLIANAVVGVSEGYTKELEIQGVGYRAIMEGEELVLSLGYSHPVKFKAPESITLKVTKNIIAVTGRDKQLVGKIASDIREFRKPEPYKGKGIRYVGEHVRRKAGKAGKAAA